MASNYIPYLPPCFTPEMEIFYENGEGPDSLYDKCEKNPGHKNFIPMVDFTMNHLPHEWRTQRMMDFASIYSALTVKISSCFISENRPATYPGLTRPYPYHDLKNNKFKIRCGTGLIVITDENSLVEGEKCPCHTCRSSNNPKNNYGCFYVHTATHVIFDTPEAAKSVFEVFYDSPNTSGVERLYGVKVTRPNNATTRAFTDMCQVMCVTHDMDLARRLDDLWQKLRELKSAPDGSEIPVDNLAIMVCHPHGVSKKISIGNILCTTYPTAPKLQTGVPLDIDCEIICRLPLFPWSKNDEDKGDNFSFPDIPGMQPGSTFPLPSGMTFTLPVNSSYGYQSHFLPDGERWMTFVPGTKLTFPPASSFCGQDIYFPPETEFFITDSKTWQKKLSERKYYYVTHNLDTCPGCSGAMVAVSSLSFYSHTGAVKGNKNISGLLIKVDLGNT